MRKVTGVILVLICCFMTGCTRERTDGKNIAIEKTNWKMNIVQSVQEGGRIIACGSENANTYEEAAVIDLSLIADHGKIVISDHSNNKTYELSYELLDSNSATSIYKIMVGEQQGNAVVSMTSPEGEDGEITLVIQLDDFALYFCKQTT